MMLAALAAIANIYSRAAIACPGSALGDVELSAAEYGGAVVILLDLPNGDTLATSFDLPTRIDPETRELELRQLLGIDG